MAAESHIDKADKLRTPGCLDKIFTAKMQLIIIPKPEICIKLRRIY